MPFLSYSNSELERKQFECKITNQGMRALNAASQIEKEVGSALVKSNEYLLTFQPWQTFMNLFISIIFSTKKRW